MVKINKKLLPIKAHYFFFMAAMGPILPQIAVFGKQLGISPDTMGYITSVLPILYVLAKPAIGYLADYFASFRKFIFILLIIIMTLSYAGFFFISYEPHAINKEQKFNFSGVVIHDLVRCRDEDVTEQSLCTKWRRMACRNENNTHTYKIFLAPVTQSNANHTIIDNISNKTFHICTTYSAHAEISMDFEKQNYFCFTNEYMYPNSEYCLSSSTFWMYIVLMCIGTIGFNVTNCISDAICFDVLGDSQEMKYGAQRVWGTIGFGITALLAGIAVDMFTTDTIKSITPALIVMLIFSGFDLISASKLKLPKLSSDSITKDVCTLLKQSRVATFLAFATMAGILDAFIIFFMFWHLEEIAARTGYMDNIKLIEGCVVAAECLCGEIPMFLFSGKILKKLGYVHCFSLCFFTYSIRLALISLIPNPWWLVGIELVMQGCTYALCYTCIVAYASAIAPPGTSATVQGLVAGMDDGLGFAIGSFIGGKCYRYFGGARSFQLFSCAALIACICHIILRPASKHETHVAKQKGYVLPSDQFKGELVEQIQSEIKT